MGRDDRVACWCERERAGCDSALERERASEEERGMTQRERVR